MNPILIYILCRKVIQHYSDPDSERWRKSQTTMTKKTKYSDKNTQVQRPKRYKSKTRNNDVTLMITWNYIDFWISFSLRFRVFWSKYYCVFNIVLSRFRVFVSQIIPFRDEYTDGSNGIPKETHFMTTAYFTLKTNFMHNGKILH